MGRLSRFVFTYVYHSPSSCITGYDDPFQSTFSTWSMVTPPNEIDDSELQPSQRTDLLKGLLIVLTYLCMTMFDASRVYHSIRGQSSIKLYVLFNVLDVFPLESVDIDCGSSLLFDRPRYFRRFIFKKCCGTHRSNPTRQKMDREYYLGINV